MCTGLCTLLLGGAPMSGVWPEFELGNTVGLRHGAHSEQVGQQDAAALLEEVEGMAPPWLTTVDRAALAAWAYAEGRVRRLRSWLDGQDDLLRADGTPHPAELLLIRWERRAESARERLGFDPLSRARLTRDTAVGAALVAEGLEQVRRAGRATRALPDGDAAGATETAPASAWTLDAKGGVNVGKRGPATAKRAAVDGGDGEELGDDH